MGIANAFTWYYFIFCLQEESDRAPVLGRTLSVVSKIYYFYFILFYIYGINPLHLKINLIKDSIS